MTTVIQYQQRPTCVPEQVKVSGIIGYFWQSYLSNYLAASITICSLFCCLRIFFSVDLFLIALAINSVHAFFLDLWHRERVRVAGPWEWGKEQPAGIRNLRGVLQVRGGKSEVRDVREGCDGRIVCEMGV